jgi:hypothetical protein
VGLDIVEFVMGVEEAFQIAIPDHEAERILTPNQLVDYVLARVEGPGSPVCLEQRAFYRLRRGAIQAFGATRAGVRPESSWEALLPPYQRRHNWRLLRLACGLAPWPRLRLFDRWPSGQETVGGTARWLGSHAAGALKGGDGWTRDEAKATIRVLMERQFGLTDFDWDAEFVKDLGLD